MENISANRNMTTESLAGILLIHVIIIILKVNGIILTSYAY